ncbi:unnamed protein product [Cuscuta campestris]|uniref:CCHC-type domain-containing protein n=1 Tax=Cuscuta campestris TaxID=132261 RepID=A0A484NLX4_9ASTE|nr:unnamed protein product [Cuscuta campestris]
MAEVEENLVGKLFDEEEKIPTKGSSYELKNADTPGLIITQVKLNALAIQRDKEKVHQFLMGLDNEGYGSLRSNIIATEPLPPLNRVYSTIIQQEGVLKTTQEEERNPVGFVVTSKFDRDATKDLKCKHCGLSGHEKSGCFQLVGYPEWWGDRPRVLNPGRGNGRGNNTGGRRGGRGGNAGRANRGGAGGGPAGGPAAHTAQANATDGGRALHQPNLPSLTTNQWNTLMGLLNKKDSGMESKFSGMTNTSWIIDSGASQYMTDLSLAAMVAAAMVATTMVGGGDGEDASVGYVGDGESGAIMVEGDGGDGRRMDWWWS